MVKDIKKLLKSTDLPMTEIAKKFNVSPKTVRNINQGTTYHDKNLVYPIRITSKRIQEIKRELSIPTREAVPNPQILSPQLLDYIGFLSMLEVDIDCLLTFKDVYYKPLKSLFGRELSDQDILSIIKLRPKRPRPLRELIEAYDFPKVQLLNKDYWVEKELIQKGEEEAINSLLLKG